MKGTIVRNFLISLTLAGVASCVPNAGIQNVSGSDTVDLDPSQRGAVYGTGIESHDIAAMADMVARDLLPKLPPPQGGKAPQVLIEGETISNEGTQVIDLRLLSDRLKIELNRSCEGRMRFVGRHSRNNAIAERERKLKRSGVTDAGTTGLARAPLGVDYFLTARIGTQDSRDQRTGKTQRFTQIMFTLIDVENDEEVWISEEPYVIKRASGNDAVYR